MVHFDFEDPLARYHPCVNHPQPPSPSLPSLSHPQMLQHWCWSPSGSPGMWLAVRILALQPEGQLRSLESLPGGGERCQGRQ